MKSYYDTIYIAPHLDDVVLSCGGQIYEEIKSGKHVLVVTIMAGDPPSMVSTYAQSLHNRWKLAKEATKIRRQEDVNACALLGADTLHGQIPDCIYRSAPATGTPLYSSDDDIFGTVHPADKQMINDVATQLRALPPCNRMVVPLAVGNHVDHQITRNAAEYRIKKQLEFYEDYPYIQTVDALDFLQASAKIIWQAKVISVSHQALQAKIDAILAYKSQISTFFQDREDLEQQITRYAHNVNGERVWLKSKI